MYMIIGVQADGRQCLVGTPAMAGAALAHYRAAHRLYPHVRIQSCGETLDEAELAARAAGEGAR